MANIENMGTNVGTQVLNTGSSWLTEYVYESYADMVNKPMNTYPIGTDNIPEGQMVYCLDDQKYYIYREQTTYGNKVTGSNRWLKLDSYIQDNNVYVLDDSLDTLGPALKDLHTSIATGGLVYAKCNNTLYFNTFIKNLNPGEDQPPYLENSTGYFYPVPSGESFIDIEKDLSEIKDYINGDQPTGIKYQFGEINSKLDQLGTNVDTLSTLHANFDTRLTNLDTKITNTDSMLATFVNDMDSLETQVDSFNAKLSSIDGMTLGSDVLGDALGTDESLVGLGTVVKWLGTNVATLMSNYPSTIELGSDITGTDEPLSGLGTVIDWLGTNVATLMSNSSLTDVELGTEITGLDEPLTGLDEAVNWLGSNININKEEILNIKDDLTNNYVKNSELSDAIEELLPGLLPDIPDTPSPGDIIDSEEFIKLKNSVTTNTNAIAEVSDRVDDLDKTVSDNHKNTQDAITATQGMIVSSISGLQHNVEVLTKGNSELIDNCNELNKVTQDHTNKLDGWEETIDGSVIQHKGLVEDLSDFKQHVEDTYAKPEDVSSLLNYYSPDVAYQNKWVGLEEYPDLVGKTGKEIALERHSYNSIFDQIIFADYEPTVSEPFANVALKEDWANGMSIDWYDEAKRIILVKDGSVGPDGGDFYPTNVQDAMISYPKNITLDPHFTNGPILKSDTKQSSVGFCKIQNESGEWDYYKKDNNIYHVPATLSTGEYRYYMATYFTKGSPAINNNGLTIKEWNENVPIESEDYITIIASKPTYYNTLDGEVENPLQPWSDNMVDTMELLPSCQCPQQFRTPKPLKHLYIWNDLVGDYARVPSNDGVPAYMIRTVEADGYYKYSYDSNTFGHRGGIKVKIEF